MVFVPWESFGLCKYWMLDPTRCYQGSRCKWQHPAPNERKRLWLEHTGDDYQQPQYGLLDFETALPPPGHPVDERYDTASQSQPRRIFERIQHLQSVAVSESRYQGSSDRHRPAPTGTTFEQPVTDCGERPNYSRLPWVRKSEPSSEIEQQAAPPQQVEPAMQDRTRVGAEDITRAAETDRTWSFELMRNGKDTSFLTTSALDAPPSPGSEHFGGIKQAPDSRYAAPNTEFNNTYSGTKANSEPLGRPNRLLSGANVDSGPSLGDDVPTAAARSVWKRTDSELGQTLQGETSEPGEKGKPGTGGYGERMRARKAARENEEEGGEVRRKPEGPLAESAPSLMLPPPRPPTAATTTLSTQLDVTSTTTSSPPVAMGATKRMSNGEAKPIGPHPSTIKVSQPFTSQAALEKQLSLPGVDVQEKSLAEAREDSLRLQGVTWLDSTRRALQLPIRTFTTACVYYHKFRLAHPGVEYAWADAAAASLLQSCKVEDTLKKSKDILAAAYNLKASGHEQLGADDSIFDNPSRAVIGLERLVLESGGFDFRSRYPHRVLVKLCRNLPASAEREKVGKVAWTILTDLHRTFAPLKQTSATLAVACLELAAHLRSGVSGTGMSEVRDNVQMLDLKAWSTTREEIMETLLDALDLYTHHTTSTILGTKHSLDDFLHVRLALNKECSESNLPRYTAAPEATTDRSVTSAATLRVANGHPTPVSPPETGAQPQVVNGPPPAPEGGGTLRFILNPQLAADEKAQVQRYFVEEWEEYEEEIEVPLPPRSREHERDKRADDARSDRGSDRGSERRPAPPSARDHERSGREHPGRDLLDDRRPRDDHRERDRERERARTRDKDRERRFDDRRYDERDRYDRRDRFDRRYDDERRRRDDRR